MGASVWRAQDTEDFFEIAANGVVEWSFWSVSNGWASPVDLGTIASPETDVRVVSRTPDTLDLFVIGFDGAVWSRFWNTMVGWDPGGFFRVSPSGLFNSLTQTISAVSRASDKLNLFAIGTDGAVRSTFWNAAEGWNPTGWFLIHSETVFDQSTQKVYAASRTSDSLELYVLGGLDINAFWWTSWTAEGGWDAGGWVKVQSTRSISSAQGVSVVSRTPSTLDLFATGSDNAIWSTFWNEASGWNPSGWFKLPGATLVTPASLSVVTREADTLDLFAIGPDNAVWSTFWNTAGGWAQDWFRIGTANIFNHSSQKISAISPFPNELDLFVIGVDNRVWSTFWTAAAGWRPEGWFQVPDTIFFDNTAQQVSVVSRTPDTLDLFAIGFDGAVWSTFRNEANGWAESWFPIASGTTFDHTKHKLSAVSRAPDKLDLFVIGPDGVVWSTFWNAAGGWWGSWFQLAAVPVAAEFSPVSVVSRRPDNIDLFVSEFGTTSVWSRHWNAAEGWNPGGWQLMYPNRWYVGENLNSSVSAISRTADDIDLFMTGWGFAGSDGTQLCVSTFWTSASGRWSPPGWFPIVPTSVLEPTI